VACKSWTHLFLYFYNYIHLKEKSGRLFLALLNGPEIAQNYLKGVMKDLPWEGK